MVLQLYRLSRILLLAHAEPPVQESLIPLHSDSPLPAFLRAVYVPGTTLSIVQTHCGINLKYDEFFIAKLYRTQTLIYKIHFRTNGIFRNNHIARSELARVTNKTKIQQNQTL